MVKVEAEREVGKEAVMAARKRGASSARRRVSADSSTNSFSKFPLSLLFCDDVTVSSSETAEDSYVNGLVKVNDNVLLRFSAILSYPLAVEIGGWWWWGHPLASRKNQCPKLLSPTWN